MRLVKKVFGSFKYSLLLLTFFLLIVACSKAPVTGRSQLILISESQEIQLGLTAYDQVLSSEKLSSNQEYVSAVKRVGNKIAPFTEKNYNWRFNVIESSQVNAWCLPGGKIAFYEGILDIMENEGQIAAVMGHEIAHATARHGGERISLGILTQVGAIALQIALREEDPAIQYAVFQAYIPAVSIGAILPFSRKQEYEADRMGMVYMARAQGLKRTQDSKICGRSQKLESQVYRWVCSSCLVVIQWPSRLIYWLLSYGHKVKPNVARQEAEEGN